jgi:homoserine kinase type II
VAVAREYPASLPELLRAWRLPADADTHIGRPDWGTNNQTFVVAPGGRRFVLRISENLSVAQVRAEHRLLGWLRQANLPFAVPEPVATSDGLTVIDTPAGPATLCRWLPGVRPDLESEAALERFGRAVGMLGRALEPVRPADAPQDWRGGPFPVPVDGADGEDLWHELRAAGVHDERVALLEGAARRYASWWAGAVGALPVQVVHGDLAASNVLADPDTAQVTALLDFEIAGADFRIQDFLVALSQSGALGAAQWQRRTAAFLRGYAPVRPLTAAEVEALPELLLARSAGSVLWRAGRWRRGQDQLAEVVDRIQRLETTVRWLAASGSELVALVGARAAGPPENAASRSRQNNPLNLSETQEFTRLVRPDLNLILW